MAKALLVYARQMIEHYQIIVLSPIFGYEELALENIRADYAQDTQPVSSQATESVFFTRARFSGKNTLTARSRTTCE
jgi:hypothetical protein